MSENKDAGDAIDAYRVHVHFLHHLKDDTSRSVTKMMIDQNDKPLGMYIICLLYVFCQSDLMTINDLKKKNRLKSSN